MTRMVAVSLAFGFVNLVYVGMGLAGWFAPANFLASGYSFYLWCCAPLFSGPSKILNLVTPWNATRQ